MKRLLAIVSLSLALGPTTKAQGRGATGTDCDRQCLKVEFAPTP